MSKSRFCNLDRIAIAGSLALLCTACASQQSAVENREQMLAAAGFVEKPADTPQRANQLAGLPPFKLERQQVRVNGGNTFGYIYADPQYCRCVLVGDAKAYQQFRNLALQQKIADEELTAAEIANDNAFDWGIWGPYGYWGGAPAVIVQSGPGWHR